MQVSRLGGALGLRRLAQQLCQTLHTRHPDNVDVVVTAKGLNECEVDLQGNVILLLLVNGQQAQDHAVRVPEGPKEGFGSAGGLREGGGGRRAQGSLHKQRETAGLQGAACACSWRRAGDAGEDKVGA